MCIDYNNVRIDWKYSECLNPFAIACSIYFVCCLFLICCQPAYLNTSMYQLGNRTAYRNTVVIKNIHCSSEKTLTKMN